MGIILLILGLLMALYLIRLCNNVLFACLRDGMQKRSVTRERQRRGQD